MVKFRKIQEGVLDVDFSCTGFLYSSVYVFASAHCFIRSGNTVESTDIFQVIQTVIIEPVQMQGTFNTDFFIVHWHYGGWKQLGYRSDFAIFKVSFHRLYIIITAKYIDKKRVCQM